MKNITIKEVEEIINNKLKENYESDKTRILSVSSLINRETGLYPISYKNDLEFFSKLNVDFKIKYKIKYMNYRYTHLKENKRIPYKIEYVGEKEYYNKTISELKQIEKDFINKSIEIQDNLRKEKINEFNSLLEKYNISKDEFIELYYKYNKVKYDI